jgi:hypothetical protein
MIPSGINSPPAEVLIIHYEENNYTQCSETRTYLVIRLKVMSPVMMHHGHLKSSSLSEVLSVGIRRNKDSSSGINSPPAEVLIIHYEENNYTQCL